jgi:hypothetical protein
LVQRHLQPGSELADRGDAEIERAVEPLAEQRAASRPIFMLVDRRIQGIPEFGEAVQHRRMRAGIVSVTSEDRRRLEAIVGDRNAKPKHVARAKVVLATAESCGR